VDIVAGEGSYSTWTTNLDAFLQAPPDVQALPKNQLLRQCFLEHAGHTYRVYDEDLAFEEEAQQEEA
jgi:hypothetical protein